MVDNIEPLYFGDIRLDNICNSIKEILYERCEGMPLPTVLGLLKCVEIEILKDMDMLDD